MNMLRPLPIGHGLNSLLSLIVLTALGLLVFLSDIAPVGAQADDPPVNFRVTGSGDDWIGVAWEVPRDQGITNYSLQRYKHDGTDFVSEGSDGYIDGETNGGTGHSFSDGALEADTRYKYTLKLKISGGDTIREASATGRTLPVQPPASSDATLSSLSLSGISISFDPDTTDYVVDVANSVSMTIVTATTTDADAYYNVTDGNVSYGTPSHVPVIAGQNVISIRVTAADRETRKTYTVTVNRAWPPATLSALNLSDVSLSFAWDTTSYAVTVPNNISQTTVSATVRDAGGSYQVTLKGEVDTDRVIPLTVGQNVITVEVAAPGGGPTRTYTVTVTRAEALSVDATLSGLTITGDPLWSPAFNPAITGYALQVAGNVSEVTVTATTNDANASYVVKVGSTTDHDRVISLNQGRNIIKVEVTAQDRATTKTYTLAITRTDAPVPTLGELPTDDPPVNFRVTGSGNVWMTVAWEVPQDRGITNYVLQRYKHNGTSYISEGNDGYVDGETNGGAGHAFSNGALDADTRYQYTLRLMNDAGITIIKQSAAGRTLPGQPSASGDATLSSLSLSDIELAFDPETVYYFAMVSNTVSETIITATTSDADAFYTVTSGGTSYGTLTPIELQEGQNVITITVNAADRETSKTYTLVVNRAGSDPTALGSPGFIGQGSTTDASGDIEVTWAPGANSVGQLLMLFTSDFVGDPVVATKGATDTTHTFTNVPEGDYVVVVVAYNADVEIQLVITTVSVPGS